MKSADAAKAFAALGHTLRVEVWCMLLESGSLGLPAGAIAARLAIAPSSLSFHLQQMIQGGILLQRRFSRQVIYSVNEEVVGLLFGFLTGEVALRPSPGALPALQTSDVIGNRQGERNPFGFGDDLAPAADLGS
jgi:ArsR family transcriptional regulator